MAQAVRAEHPSMAEYLQARLTPEQLGHVLFTSFNQWGFALAALADTALSLDAMGADVTCAFWSGHTPMRDAGWTTNHRVAHLLGSRTQDERVRDALIAAGLPASAMADPPIRHWRPCEDISVRGPVNRSAIRAMTYRGSPMGRAILQVHPDTNTPVTDAHAWPQRWVRTAARSYAYVYDQVRALIDERGITAVAVFNGRFLHDRATAEAAADAGLPVMAYELSGNETDFDLTTDPTHDWAALQHRMLDLYAAWPPDERVELGSRWFEDRIRHADPQNAMFVDSQTPGTRMEPVDAEVVVAYFSSSGDEIAELELDWDAFFGGQGNALALLADQVRELPGHALVVRTHPHKRFKPEQDVVEWLADVAAAQPAVHIDQNSPIDSYEVMRQADIIVTYGSTTGVEAAYAGKPVIVMGPSAYDILGCATPVSTEAQLRRALMSRQPGDRDAALAWGLMMMRRGFVFEHVQLDPVHGFRLANVPFADARPAAMHLSHRTAQWRQRWLTSR